MEKELNILAPVRYPWRFNGPRNSKHNISNRYFAPLNKISRNIEGATVFNPFPLKRFDLIHGFNRIPIGTTPYIIGFESHLPRAFCIEHTKLFAAMAKSLSGNRCRGIVAISEYAKRLFLNQHENRPWFPELAEKLIVRYPNIHVPDTPDQYIPRISKSIHLLFVGNHFGRKGGTAVVRLAEKAHKAGLPVHVEIISTLEVGACSWVDPRRTEYFDSYFELMNTLPNVSLTKGLPNIGVIKKVITSDFVLLPTFADTFGFSVIEAMANHTPVIATNQGALGEFIVDNKNGFLLDLDTDNGDWVHTCAKNRDTLAYETLFTEETERLADQMLAKIEYVLNGAVNYTQMRVEAHNTAKRMFCSKDADMFWDNLYEQAVSSACPLPLKAPDHVLLS